MLMLRGFWLWLQCTCEAPLGQIWPALALDPVPVWIWVIKSLLLLSGSPDSGTTSHTCQTEHAGISYPSNTLLEENTRIQRGYYKYLWSETLHRKVHLLVIQLKQKEKGFNVWLLRLQQTCSPSLCSPEWETSRKLTYLGQNLADLLNLRLRKFSYVNM